jgi:CheY-like chemotaxis protein
MIDQTSRIILLVEDDEADARLLQRAFQKSGGILTVLRLSNGDDAVNYLSGEGPFANRAMHPLPAVVVLDIKLPRLSGLEILRWIRARQDSLRLLPVVMLTSSRHAVDVNRAYGWGANSYLTKPDTAQQLTEMAANFQAYWFNYNEKPILGNGVPG